MTAPKRSRKAFEAALGNALGSPALAWRDRARVTGPHFAALEVAKIYKDVMGRLPSFESFED